MPQQRGYQILVWTDSKQCVITALPTCVMHTCQENPKANKVMYYITHVYFIDAIWIKNGWMWGSFILFCDVMDEILTAGGVNSCRLQTKSIEQHCNYSSRLWLIRKWEMELKGWGVLTRSCCTTNKHVEGWAWVLQSRRRNAICTCSLWDKKEFWGGFSFESLRSLQEIKRLEERHILYLIHCLSRYCLVL